MNTETTRRALFASAGLVGVALAVPSIASAVPAADRSAWDAALRHFERQAAAYVASMDAFNGAETRFFANDTPANNQAYNATQAAMLDCCGDSCDAVRALVAVPAPDAAAALIKAQIALDSGQYTDDGLALALAADLRRFTRYANQEA